jgi:hypothetical protein
MKDIEAGESTKKEKERRESLLTDATAKAEVPGLDVNEATAPSRKGSFQGNSSFEIKGGDFCERISYTPKLCHVQD